MRSDEALGAPGRVLRTTGDTTTCVTASYTRKYDERNGPNTVYNYDCYNWVLSNINFWTEVQSYVKLSYLGLRGSWNIC